MLSPGHQTKDAASYEIYYVVKRLGPCLLVSWFAWNSAGPEESTFVKVTSMLGREAMTRAALRSGGDGSPAMAMGNAKGLRQREWAMRWVSGNGNGQCDGSPAVAMAIMAFFAPTGNPMPPPKRSSIQFLAKNKKLQIWTKICFVMQSLSTITILADQLAISKSAWSYFGKHLSRVWLVLQTINKRTPKTRT